MTCPGSLLNCTPRSLLDVQGLNLSRNLLSEWEVVTRIVKGLRVLNDLNLECAFAGILNHEHSLSLIHLAEIVLRHSTPLCPWFRQL